MVRDPTNLTYSSQSSHYFGNYNNNDTYFVQLVITAIHGRQNIICEWYGRIGHKSDYCITRGTKFLQLSPGIKMNQYNSIHGNEPPGLQWEWNSKPP